MFRNASGFACVLLVLLLATLAWVLHLAESAPEHGTGRVKTPVADKVARRGHASSDDLTADGFAPGGDQRFPSDAGFESAPPAAVEASPDAAGGDLIAMASADLPAERAQADDAVVRIYDAASGAAVTGAAARMSAYHGSVDPAFAAHPRLEFDSGVVASDGSLAVPAFRPNDPNLLVHVQIDHPDYAAATVVLHRRPDDAARWQPRDVYLRRASTARVRLVTIEGEPLVEAPVRVTTVRGSSDLRDSGEVWIAPRSRGQLVAANESTVFYTDAAGDLRLPYVTGFCLLELLAPVYELVHHDPFFEEPERGRIRYHAPLDGSLGILQAEPRQRYTLTLFDLDGAIVRDTRVEAVVHDRVQSSRTDEQGRVTLGVAVPTSLTQPTVASLTTLSPDYFQRTVTFPAPREPAVATLGARTAPRLRFRALRVVDDVERPVEPITPSSVQLAHEMTLVRLDGDGGVHYVGELPPAGIALEIFISGFLPRYVTTPPLPIGAAELDLGDIVFDPGWTREVDLRGLRLETDDCRGCSVLVSSEGDPHLVHRYVADRAERVLLGGLSRGFYTVTIEGPDLATRTTRFEMLESLQAAPLSFDGAWVHHSRVRSAGAVHSVAESEFAGAEVIELYQVAGTEGEVKSVSYPLAPDGSFGTTLEMENMDLLRVGVVTPQGRVALGVGGEPIAVGKDRWLYEFGLLNFLKRPSARIDFIAPGLGRVEPPHRVSVHDAAGFSQLARFRVYERSLWIDSLLPGAYDLRWQVGDGAEATVGLVIRSNEELRVRVERSVLPEETIEILVVDRDRRPIESAAVSPSGRSFGVDRDALPPGIHLTRIRTRETTTLRVEAPGFVHATATIEAGGVAPSEVILYGAARAKGLVLDADGLPAVGELWIDWRPLKPSRISYGDRIAVELTDGRFVVDELPALPLEFTFRLADSSIQVQRTASLVADDEIHDFGTLPLIETRSLSGTVFLPDGSRAAGADVLLVDERFLRVPLRSLAERDVRFRATTDSQGAFELREIPLALDADLLLVARLDGYGDAFAARPDLGESSYELQLSPAAGLELAVGYLDAAARPEFRFALEFQPDPEDVTTRTELGEIPAELYGANVYENIEPGLYRVTWGPRDAYEPIAPLTEEVVVVPGEIRSLHLTLEGRELRGTASLNGQAVERGWILLTDEPGASSSRVGRIVDSRFLVVDPPLGFQVYGAIVPEGKPQAQQNIARGEALPLRVPLYDQARRNGFLRFDYVAYDLRLKFSEEFLHRYPGAQLVYDQYRWDGSRFVSYKASELVAASFVDFRLLRPAVYRLSLRTASGGLIVARPIAIIDHDTEIELR